jgi:hypothetical protein
VEKLGFTDINHGIPARLRMPGDSGQELDIAAGGPDVKSGIQLGVADLQRTVEILTSLKLDFKAAQGTSSPAVLTIADPDGAVISFVKAAAPAAGAR